MHKDPTPNTSRWQQIKELLLIVLALAVLYAISYGSWLLGRYLWSIECDTGGWLFVVLAVVWAILSSVVAVFVVVDGLVDWRNNREQQGHAKTNL